MKKILKKHWPLLGIGILALVVGFYLMGGQNEIAQKLLLVDEVLEEGVKLKDIHYTQNNPDEGLKWNLDAEEIKISKDRQFISFKSFRLRLEPENRPPFELEGRRGEYDKSSGELNLHGDLRGYSHNGYRIVTEHIIYKHREGYLKTEAPVKITGPFFSVEGRGLYYNLDREILKIDADVTTLLDNEALT